MSDAEKKAQEQKSRLRRHLAELLLPSIRADRRAVELGRQSRAAAKAGAPESEVEALDEAQEVQFQLSGDARRNEALACKTIGLVDPDRYGDATFGQTAAMTALRTEARELAVWIVDGFKERRAAELEATLSGTDLYWTELVEEWERAHAERIAQQEEMYS